MSLQLEHPLVALPVFLALSIWALRAYARSLPPLPRNRRLLLTGLRLLASLLLSLMLGGLSGTVKRVEQEAPRLRILVDASASMSRPAASDSASASRYARALELAAAAQERWEGRLAVSTEAFGLGLLGGPPPGTPSELGTDLGAILAALPAPRPGESLLLISDGRDTEGSLWTGELLPGRPIHCALVGDTLPPPDLRIERVDALPVLHRGARLAVTVEISSQGGAARRGRLQLREGEEMLAEEEWELAPGTGLLRREIPLVLEETGRHLLELRVLGDGPDDAPENNRRLLTLRVVEGELRILVLAGRPDWDLAALMSGLQGETALALTLVTAGPEGGLREAATGAPWDPAANEYHGLLLHSLHQDWPADLLGTLRVRGGALILGAYLARPGRQAPPHDWGLESIRSAPLQAEAALDWGSGASRHPAVQGALTAGLDPRDQAPLESILANPLVGGRILLRSGSRPVLVARELGGRSLVACSGRGLWRWGLRSADGGLFLEKLFSGLLRWLAREDPPDRLLVTWEGNAIYAGRAGELRAELFDEDFVSQSGAELGWSLRRGEELVAAGDFREEPGTAAYRAELPALAEAVYRLEVESRGPTGEQLRRVLDLPILPPDREFLQPAASAETLRCLASRSGGLFLPDADLGALEGVLDLTPLRRTLTRAVRIWQHPLLFLLLLGLFASEWGLRKRFGMV